MSELMKTAVFHGINDISLEECERPHAYGNKVLVKIDCCALCTWEQRVYTGVNNVEYPFIGGHETSGTIVELGEDINTREWAVGDKVVVGNTCPCGDCYYCKTFEEQTCSHFSHSLQLEGLPYHGMGGLSEYMLVNTHSLFKYYNASPQEASLIEPLSCVVHSVETADIQLGDFVLIIGCGIMGQLHVQLSKKRGAVVIVSEINKERADLAKKNGADYVIDPSNENLTEKVLEYTHRLKCQVVFDTTPFPTVLQEAYTCVSNAGKVILYSSIHPRSGESKLVPIDAGWMHSWSIKTLGTANSNSRDFVRAAALVSGGIVNLKPFVSGIYHESQVKDAFEKAIEGSSYRIVVNFDQE
ncbi:zinc-binding dehydrogenase [Atopobium sp. oral taxon 416]|uniref:zinc-dependent alcohol dehydrogenase n=1 Tax=Atopobium sp. oral taxon 416 TaxID=712157 RepID=UPI001BA90D8F|nr:alcohol dehydrogenase catalytic domain-containing protein [Atopobium sp. oral taxon 416]QUC04096.1 alcohol dehydrogenase catalytic domain-containing protein [Atopobium sp. oral taxon 416]